MDPGQLLLPHLSLLEPGEASYSWEHLLLLAPAAALAVWLMSCVLTTPPPFHLTSTLLRGLEGVPGLPGAPQDEAGLTRILL